MKQVNQCDPYNALIRSVMGMAEMKATRRFDAETRTPICQSLTKPGGIRALYCVLALFLQAEVSRMY